MVLSVLFLCLLPACKNEPSTQTEEEAAYLADYEAPVHKWGFMAPTGDLVIKPMYDDVGTFSEGLAAVCKGGKWGYIDKKGKMVIEPQFKAAWAFHDQRARVETFDQRGYFTDRAGNPLASDQWSAADDFAEGFAKVKVGSTFGYIDTSGQLRVQAIYSRGWNFQHGVVIIEYDEKLGIINSSGQQIIPPRYDQIKINKKGNVILCRLNQSSTAFDIKGNELAHQDNIKWVDSDGHLISTRKGDRMFFFDLSRMEIKSGEDYSNVIYLDEGRWAGRKEAGYFLLDGEGRMMKEKAYTQINQFVDGIAVYKGNEYWGYLDYHGNELTGEVFGLAWDYKEGVARAAFQDGLAFIDGKQQLAFYPPPGTQDMRDFSEGLAAIQIAR